jgi:hypothetical protein
MNITPDGETVRFKTGPESLFEAEKSGAKPNTVRILDAYEADLIRRNPPTKIIIHDQQESFTRTLSHIHLNYNVLGKVIAIFSWTNENKEDDTPAETCQVIEKPSIDERFAAITISNGTLALLQGIAHGRTMNMVIKELYEAYTGSRGSTFIPSNPPTTYTCCHRRGAGIPKAEHHCNVYDL